VTYKNTFFQKNKIVFPWLLAFARGHSGFEAMDKVVGQAEDRKLRDAFAQLDADLANGIPCALGITNTQGKGGHAVAVTGMVAGPPKQYLIHDPWDGKTVYVNAADLQRGKVNPTVAGWTNVYQVFTSK
jgi:hypothetical protein